MHGRTMSLSSGLRITPNLFSRLCVAAFLLGGSWLAAQTHAGKVSRFLPLDHVVRAAQALEVAAQMPVAWGDLVKTEPGGRVRIALEDGSVLNVGSASSLTVIKHDASAQQTHLELLYGRLRAKAAKISKPGGEFRVRTRTAVIGVVGTEEYIEASEQTTLVIALGGGQVMVRSAAQAQAEAVILKPGEAVEVEAGQAPGAKRLATAAELLRAYETTAFETLSSALKGATLEATLTSTLDAATSKLGAPVVAKTVNDARVEGKTVLAKNVRVEGFVRRAQARSKQQKESRLEFVLFRAVLRDGEEVALPAALQAVAAPASAAATFADESAIAASSSPASGGGTRSGGLLSGVTSTANAAASAATGTVGPVDGKTGLAGSVAGGAAGSLTAASTGVMGLSGISLAEEAGTHLGTAALTSTKQNVRLGSGTRLLLRIEANPSQTAP